MTHERDQSHALTTSGPTADLDDTAAPGRAARTDALLGPNGPRPTGLLMRKGDGGVAPDAEHAVGAAASSSGHALPDDLRTKFEGSLGTDLSSVRVHTGAASADAASAVGAKAYATGNDIHFGSGHYDAASSGGQELIAHEVAHTVQQRGGSPQRQHKLEVSSVGDHAELEADRAASAMVSGATFSLGASSSALHRAPAPAPDDEHRKETISKIQGTSTFAAYISNKMSTISSQSLAAARGASSTLTANAAAYCDAYKEFDDRLAKADKNVARKEAIKDAVAETLITAALMAILGPDGLLLGAELKAMEEAAEVAQEAARKAAAAGNATGGAVKRFAEKQAGKVATKAVEGAVDAGGKAVMHGDAHEGKAGRGSADGPKDRLSIALASCDKIIQSLPDIGHCQNAATEVMSVATLVITEEKVEKLDASFASLQLACAALSGMGNAAAAAQTKLKGVTGPIIAVGTHKKPELEDQLWRQWVASLTDADSKKVLADSDLHRYLESRGIVAKADKVDDSVTTMQKDFLRQHGVTPTSEEPEVIQSLYKREVALARLRLRLVGKQGKLLDDQKVEVDGQTWQCMKNSLARVGDAMEVSFVYPLHGETPNIETWTDIDFQLMCKSLSPHPEAGGD